MELLELTGSKWPKRRRLLAHPVISLLRSNRLRAKTVLAEQVMPAEHIGLLRPIKILFGPFDLDAAGCSFKKAGEVTAFGRRALIFSRHYLTDPARSPAKVTSSLRLTKHI